MEPILGLSGYALSGLVFAILFIFCFLLYHEPENIKGISDLHEKMDRYLGDTYSFGFLMGIVFSPVANMFMVPFSIYLLTTKLIIFLYRGYQIEKMERDSILEEKNEQKRKVLLQVRRRIGDMK